tara:strand:- start:1378 stop:1911 length:534 start_codon:yes stop_codon:yes gene_type:complete
MKLIRLFENQLSSSIIKEFNQQIKKNIISDFYGKAKSATKTSTVTNIKYGDIEYYMNPIFDMCQINNIDTLGYNIYQPTRHNLLHYNIYNKGNEYTWHSDGTVWNQNFDQKYTILINLSEEKYEGGEFDLFDNGIEEQKFNSGDMLMFTSHIPHRVRPVTKGQRITLSYWMIGPRFQ